jgi:hypothetical protein
MFGSASGTGGKTDSGPRLAGGLEERREGGEELVLAAGEV